MQMTPIQAQIGHDPYADVAGIDDVGWFGSSLVKSVKKAVKSVAHVAERSLSSVPLVNYTPLSLGVVAARATRTGIGSALSHQVSQYGRDARSLTTRRGITSLVSAALPAAQRALGTNPFGMVGNAALSAMATGLKGGNLAAIAESAARGAIPDEIELAVDVASDVVRGKNVIKAALSRGVQHFAPGTHAELGFNVARKVLNGDNVSKLALGLARRQMPSEEARRSFDAAVGTAAEAARTVRRVVAPRYGSMAPVRRTSPKVQFRGMAPWIARAIAQHSPRTPFGALFGSNVGDLEDNGTTYRVVSGDSAWKIAQTLTGTGNRWKELVAANSNKPKAKDGNFKYLNAGESLKLPASWLTLTQAAPAPAEATTTVATPAPAASAAIGGLRENGTRYEVASGDYAGKIALKLTGIGSKWPQLIAANPRKPTDAKGNFKTLFAGEILIVPTSWRKTTTATTTTTTPAATANATLQARAILVAWSNTDGRDEAGASNYGTATEDQLPTWGARDILECRSFASWSNRRRGTSLATDGALTDAVVVQLQAWAREYATAQAATPTTIPTVPTVPTVSVPQLPTVTPSTSLPTVVPSVALPTVVPSVPVSVLPTLSASATPAEVVHMVELAISAGDPAQMLRLAAELQRRGYLVEAAALRAAAAEQAATPQPPMAADAAAILAQGLIGRDPAQMRASAKALRARGFTREAAALEAAAAEIERMNPAVKAKPTGGDGFAIGAGALIIAGLAGFF